MKTITSAFKKINLRPILPHKTFRTYARFHERSVFLPAGWRVTSPPAAIRNERRTNPYGEGLLDMHGGIGGQGLRSVLAIEKHRIEQMPPDTHIDDFLDADIVFAGDDPRQYMPLLRDVRQKRPALPFIVVTRFPDTSKWLDALEAGASDYCSAPFESRQIHWLMESVLPRVWGASIDVGHSVKRAGV